MRNRISIILCGALALVMAGCNEVEIVDGRIPAEYVEQARAVTGSYSGISNGRSTTLTLALDGDRMVMTSSPDLIGQECESSIGLLRSVEIDKEGNRYTVEGGTFDFDPNRCISVEGRKLEVGLRERNGRIELSTSIMDRTEWRRECRVECYPTPSGTNCQNRCEMVPYTHYLTGRFVKMN